MQVSASPDRLSETNPSRFMRRLEVVVGLMGLKLSRAAQQNLKTTKKRSGKVDSNAQSKIGCVIDKTKGGCFISLAVKGGEIRK